MAHQIIIERIGPSGPLTLELAEGDRLFLVGPNGAGKSSLINRLARHLRAATRVVWAHRQTWFEESAVSLTPKDCLHVRRDLPALGRQYCSAMAGCLRASAIADCAVRPRRSLISTGAADREDRLGRCRTRADAGAPGEGPARAAKRDLPRRSAANRAPRQRRAGDPRAQARVRAVPRLAALGRRTQRPAARCRRARRAALAGCSRSTSASTICTAPVPLRS